MKRKRFYGGVGLHTAAGVFDANNKRLHDRADYTVAEARLTADWLNGMDCPLATMVTRESDPWDPLRPKELRGDPKPYPWIAGHIQPE